MKPLSKAVTAALKLIYNQVENYHFKTQYHSGVKRFAINEINSRNKASSTSMFDICALYTNFPDHKTKFNDGRIHSVCFLSIAGNGNKEFIRIFTFCPIWTK